MSMMSRSFGLLLLGGDTAIHDRCGNLASGKNYELLWHLACQSLFRSLYLRSTL